MLRQRRRTSQTPSEASRGERAPMNTIPIKKVLYEYHERTKVRRAVRSASRDARFDARRIPLLLRTRRSFSSFVFVHHLHDACATIRTRRARSSPAGNLHRGGRRPIDSVARPQLAPRVPSPRANRPVLRNSRRVPRPAPHTVEHVRGRRDALSSRAPRTDVRELGFVLGSPRISTMTGSAVALPGGHVSSGTPNCPWWLLPKA